MPTDMFGNFLTPEEEERLRQQQLRMGVLPGFSGGPAVDTFSDIPSSLPAYGPAAGLGPSSYMGAPQGMPTYNQSPSLAAPSLLVDAGASTPTSLFSLRSPGALGGSFKATPEHFAASQDIENQAATGAISAQEADFGKARNLIGTGFSPPLAAAGAYPYQIGQEVLRDVRDQGISGIGSGLRRGAQAGWDNLRGIGAGIYDRIHGTDPSPLAKTATPAKVRYMAPRTQMRTLTAAPFTGMESSFGTGTKVAGGPGWIGNMGIYDDLLSKKAIYDKGPGHPTVLKELVKTLDDQRDRGGGVTPGYNPTRDASIINESMNMQSPAPATPRDRSGIQKARDLARQQAANQRARDLASQQQAAANQAAANQRAQAAARAQAASQAQAAQAQAQARAVIANAAGRDRGGPSSRDLAAAREVLSQVDTFGGGRITGDRNGGAAGALGGYRGDPVGRQAAIESRGGGRGGGGRGGPGGRGR